MLWIHLRPLAILYRMLHKSIPSINVISYLHVISIWNAKRPRKIYIFRYQVPKHITLNDVIMVTGIIGIQTTRINGTRDILAQKLIGYGILRSPPPKEASLLVKGNWPDKLLSSPRKTSLCTCRTGMASWKMEHSLEPCYTLYRYQLLLRIFLTILKVYYSWIVLVVSYSGFHIPESKSWCPHLRCLILVFRKNLKLL